MSTKEDSVVVHTADVIHHGKSIVLPDGMEIDTAVDLLLRKQKLEEEVCVVIESIDAFPWDGALALKSAMNELFGWSNPEVIRSFFGNKPPAEMSVDIGPHETTMAPWGRFSLPGVTGYVETGVTKKEGRIIFQVTAQIKRKDEKKIRTLINRARELAKKESIYRGKALKIRFLDADRDRLEIPTIKFLDLSHVKEDEIVFSKEVQAAVSTSLYTPIEKSQLCRDNGIPLKRGVLLSGAYGTGKTLAAYVTARKAERHGWTFLYCERADELAEMVKFGHAYQPCAIFCEDIDRVVVGDRSISMDEILNIVDGIDSKHTEIMVILTTNHVEKINKAMVRPGRLDAIINVLPPDAKAVEALVKLYGRGLIPEGEDLTLVGECLKGQIPAVIRECVERAKLSALKLSSGGEITITSEALLDAATGMQAQLDLLNPKGVKLSDEDRFAGTISKALSDIFYRGKNVEKVANGNGH